MGPLEGGSHASDAGGLLAVLLRFNGEFAAPLKITMVTAICTEIRNITTCCCDGLKVYSCSR